MASLRILIFHGYLLRGTGSNVYNALLATALARQGHDVHLLCQERRPEDVDAVGAAGDWDDGGVLRVRPIRDGRRVTTYRPDVGPRPARLRRRSLRGRAGPDVRRARRRGDRRLRGAQRRGRRGGRRARGARHRAGQPPRDGSADPRARRCRSDVPYAVKVHGSALEYAVKPQPERFLPAAREGLARARTVLVGSRHTAESLWAAMEDPELPARTRLGPPGVDVEAFRPRPRAQATAELHALAAGLAEEALAAPPAAEAAARSPRSPATPPRRLAPCATSTASATAS